MSNVLVLGATGGTGRWVVSRALEAGHHVTAFVRDAERVRQSHVNLRIEVGDALDEASVARVVPGHDAVICALGTPGRHPVPVRTRGTQAALRAMAEHGVPRLIVLSSYGIGDSRSKLPWWMRTLMVPILLGPAFEDHESQERLVRQSDVSWTIVRPPFLTDGPATDDPLIATELPRSRMKVSRADVAGVLVDLATSRAYEGQAVAVAG